MTNMREYFRESNKIENVHDEEAVDKNVEAYQWLKHNTRRGELTHRHINKVHEIIMEDRQPEIAGEYKEERNYVSMGAKNKIFCPPEKVEEKMDKLMNIIPSNRIEALKWHLTYENVHPHLDGNGRTGRVILYWHVKDVIGGTPPLFKKEDRHAYYNLMGELDLALVDPEVEIEYNDVLMDKLLD